MTLKQLRIHLKLTQKQMAARLGISNKTYWLYENGKKPVSRPVAKLLEIEQNSIGSAPLIDASSS